MISPAFGSGCLVPPVFCSSSGSDSSGREHWPRWEPSVVSAGTRCGSDRSHPLPSISPCTGAQIGFLCTSPTAPGPVARCTLCRVHLDGIAVCRRPTGCPSAETPLESLRHVRLRARSHLVAGARSHHLCLWGRAQLGGESEPLAAIPSPGPR